MDSLTYQKQLYLLESKIGKIKDPVAYRDLTVMAKSSKNLIKELSIAEVEVRRLHKESIKYTELKTALEEALNNLENFITFALLRSK